MGHGRPPRLPAISFSLDLPPQRPGRGLWLLQPQTRTETPFKEQTHLCLESPFTPNCFHEAKVITADKSDFKHAQGALGLRAL